ncbi:hypothetical protein [Bowdeniella massiliensis]|uniref:hypothetical protein n=1 Tax=Bowdeniella massiliensis TaxID=2932264 RepID=UPI002028167C|nr:hypothetical protein [Bowdeniella massiliensis]
MLTQLVENAVFHHFAVHPLIVFPVPAPKAAVAIPAAASNPTAKLEIVLVRTLDISMTFLKSI